MKRKEASLQRGDGTRHGGVFGGVCVLPPHTHKGATHSTSVKRAPHRGDGVVSCVGSGQLTYCEHTQEPYESMSAKASTPSGRWDGAWWCVWWRLAERTSVAVFE